MWFQNITQTETGSLEYVSRTWPQEFCQTFNSQLFFFLFIPVLNSDHLPWIRSAMFLLLLWVEQVNQDKRKAKFLAYESEIWKKKEKKKKGKVL